MLSTIISLNSHDAKRLVAVSSALVLTFVWFCCASLAQAEPVRLGSSLGAESVNELRARGDHFNAVLKFRSQEGQQQRTALSDHLAAAQSAWALGLVESARSLWDEALADKNLEGADRYRTVLSRAILEIQEGNYDAARALAERSIPHINEPALSAQLYLVAAEALKSQSAFSQAERYYLEAVERADGAAKNEALYLLGENQFALGVYHSARKSFAAVEVKSTHAAKALRRLVEIDLHEQNYSGVLNWVEQGRSHYSVEFEHPWIRYATISAFLSTKQLLQAKTELGTFAKWYGRDEQWHALSRAAVESAEASQNYLRGRMKRNGGRS